MASIRLVMPAQASRLAAPAFLRQNEGVRADNGASTTMSVTPTWESLDALIGSFNRITRPLRR
jgi:hypothetical protein